MESLLDTNGVDCYADMESVLDMEPVVQNRVREMRLARELTQEQLADAVGVSRQSINSIERGRYVPSLQLALLLARAFRCAVEEIFALEKKR
jgi:putative transcriptional regulator